MGEVADALSRWTFGQATPRDGDEAARGAHLAELERKFDAWVNELNRKRMEIWETKA